MGGDHGELRESVSSGRLSKGSMSKGVIIGDQTFPPTKCPGHVVAAQNAPPSGVISPSPFR